MYIPNDQQNRPVDSPPKNSRLPLEDSEELSFLIIVITRSLTLLIHYPPRIRPLSVEANYLPYFPTAVHYPLRTRTPESTYKLEPTARG